jgi:glutamate synthase domain-containing protein 3
MTGGTVVVLGDVGKNFAAGMSGGIAFVYNESVSALSEIVNHEMVMIDKPTEENLKSIQTMIRSH